MSILVVDILCCQSLYKIFKLKDIKTVFYCSLSKDVAVIMKSLSRLSRIEFKALSEFPSSTLYKNQRSCYEEIEVRLTNLCDAYQKSLEDDPAIREYCRSNQLDWHLAKEHLKQHAYWLLYRPIEMIVKSELFDLGSSIYFLLRKSPVIHVCNPLFKKSGVKLILYKYSGFSCFIAKREESIIDEYIEEFYFNNPLYQAGKTLRDILLLAINSFCYEKFGNRFVRNNHAGIGVDKYLRTAAEDCFWFKDSQIDPEKIYYFEDRKPPAVNVEYLTRNNINRVHIVNNPMEWLRKNNKKSGKTRQLLAADWDTIKELFGKYLLQWCRSMSFFDYEHKWHALMLLQLRISYDLWKSIFHQLGIKLLISMSDIEPMNAAKTMAADYSGGLVLGGHLSNNQIYSVSTDRFYHVAFAWGTHFHSHLFSCYPVKAIVLTGYYFDFKFKDHKHKAKKIRVIYPDKFIIVFMDNVFCEDIPCSSETIQQVYNLFFDVIDSHPNVVLFVKTKRAEAFHKTRTVVPNVDDYIKNGKIVPFINDAETNMPYKPACVALAADLVVGLGISSAATESQFAGVPSFHFDLSKTENNEFVKKGLGKIVFQSVESMREAIERQINPETALCYEEIDKYYSDLDSFRDARAVERIGAYLKWLLDGFNAGLSREKAMNDAAELYCRKWGRDKIVSVH